MLMISAVCVDKLYHVDGDRHTMEGFADTDEGYQMKDAGGQPHFAFVITLLPTVQQRNYVFASFFHPLSLSVHCPLLTPIWCEAIKKKKKRNSEM